MVFTEQQLQVKKLVDVQQDIEIDALNDGVGALSSTMQNGFTEAANNFSDIQNSLESMNTLSNERYNGVTGSVNALNNAMTQGFLDMGNTVANIAEITQSTFNQINANIGDSINNLNEQITNELSVKVLSVDTMIYNISAAPVSSLTALGYDSNGKVIPVTVIANQNVVLPENANYLYTDAVGTPYAGMADTAVSANENLITSHAVYNAVNDIWADLNGFHNDVNNSINDMNVGIQSQFNGVNSSIADSNTFISMLLGFHSGNIINLYPTTYYNSNIGGYNNVTEIVFAKNTDVVGTSYGNTVLNFNTQTNILTIGTPFGIPSTGFNKVMNGTFSGCKSLNQNIQIPDGVKSMNLTFEGCKNLNQNIQIPEGVVDIAGIFAGCSNLNQNIKIPSTAINLSPSTSIPGAFYKCENLNQNILIPENVIFMTGLFQGCVNLNQDIYIYSDNLSAGIGAIRKAFYNCPLLETRSIHIRSTIPKEVSNSIYNALVNNSTGINWSGRVLNDLQKPTTWPPTN